MDIKDENFIHKILKFELTAARIKPFGGIIDTRRFIYRQNSSRLQIILQKSYFNFHL